MTDTASDRPATGLFSDLSRRFTPGAKPEIRPRLQAMFESSEEAAELQEVTEETRAGRPERDIELRAPAAVPPPPAPPAPGRQASPLQPTHATETQAPTASDDAGQESATQSEFPARVETGPPAIVPENSADQHVATLYPTREPAPPPTPTAKSSEAPVPTQVEVHDAVPVATVPETSPQPLTTHQPGPEGLDQHAEQADTRTVEPTAPPTIHIGRIELRQPPAPKPQPKLVPVPAAPPRRLTPAAYARTQGSRLTDYLGWKKK